MTFGRYYRPSAIVTLTSVAGTIFTAQDINLPPPAPRGPRIVFRVRRTLTPEPDSCDALIYNLDPIREQVASTAYNELGRASLLIFAGYEASTSRVFSGDVRRMASHVRDGPDYYWNVSADDAGDALTEITVNYQTAAITADQLVQIGIGRIVAGDPVQGILPYPLALHPSSQAVLATASTPLNVNHVGKVSELFDEAARRVPGGARWWVADNLLYFARTRFPTDGLAIVLRSNTWLADPADDGRGLMRIPVLFDPQLVPGRQVQLVDQRLLQRFVEPVPYRVEVVEHAGDTRGGPWVSSLTLRRFP